MAKKRLMKPLRIVTKEFGYIDLLLLDDIRIGDARLTIQEKGDEGIRIISQWFTSAQAEKIGKWLLKYAERNKKPQES